jgi:hypothetical protein
VFLRGDVRGSEEFSFGTLTLRCGRVSTLRDETGEIFSRALIALSARVRFGFPHE